MKTAKFISYSRVSTDKQGQDGYGMAAQEAAIAAYVEHAGGELVETFVEVESGTKAASNPELDAALNRCRKEGATLLVAKLDRLARNVAFTSALMESGVDFVVANMPGADKFRLHIEAAVAEEERRRISIRTKEGLRMAKARGVVLGNPRIHTAAAAGRQKNAKLADDFARSMHPLISGLQSSGLTTLRAIADGLNNRSIRTRHGKNWRPNSVKQLKDRLDNLAAAGRKEKAA